MTDEEINAGQLFFSPEKSSGDIVFKATDGVLGFVFSGHGVDSV